MKDRYSDAPVVAVRSTALPRQDLTQRVRIARAGGTFPLVRVEDTLRRDSLTGRPVLISQVAMVADHIIVKLRTEADEAQLAAINAKLGGTIRRKMHTPGLYLIAFSNAELDTVPEKVAAYGAEQKVVKYAEPDYLGYVEDTTPNDPYFGNLWGLTKIACPAAWDIHTGSGSVVVGIVDSGVDYNHQDLAANMWRNPGEIPDNGIDDDNNGFVDDVYGWDFFDDDNDPGPGYLHGTHVAGTVAAVGNNATGVTGVAWSLQLMALKIGGEGTTVSASAATDALHYAAMMRRRGVNIRVTNHSWGGSVYVQALRDAIAENRDAGILLVAAAGNDGSNNDQKPIYPASYALENVIAVAASTTSDTLAWFSNYGATSVDLAAPGTSIRSTLPRNTYGDMQGTSMATPHVSGAAALLFDLYPEASWQEVRDAIFQGVDPVAALQNKVATGGRLNVFRAMQHLKPTIAHVPLSNQTNDHECYTVNAEIFPAALLNTNRIWVLWNTTGATNAFVTNVLWRVQDELHQGCIPTQRMGTTVYYWLSAESTGGEKASHPSNAPAVLHSFSVVEPIHLMVVGQPVQVGNPTPPYGLHTFPSGVTVIAIAPPFANISDDVRYRCAGWNGIGSAPASGFTNLVSFTLHSMSALEWNWTLQYRLHQTSSVPEILNVSTWWDAGTTAQTLRAEQSVAVDNTEYRFVEWQIDGERQPDATSVAVDTASAVMTNARTALAIYLPATTDEDADSLPDWWERHYFGTTNASATVDSDADGFSNGEEFLDRTNPRSAESYPTPPQIGHIPVSTPVTTPAPWLITATVTDNHAVASVVLRWRRNEEQWQSEPFSPDEGLGVWTSSIPAPGTNGDYFAYSIEATDLLGLSASNGVYEFMVAYPFAEYLPTSLLNVVVAPNSVTSVTCRLLNRGNAELLWHLDLSTTENVESGTNGWTLSGTSNIWHISTNRWHSPNHSWYLGQKTSKGWRYTPSLQAELNTPPLRLWQRPRLSFWHWIASELDNAKPGYAWDGGVVKISTNGVTYTQITPIGGYPYRISYWQPPQFPQDTPCFAGTGDWQQVTFDLSAYEDKVVTFRFEFRGDDNTQEEGWYIDDLYVTSELDTNHWFFVAPTNGSVAAGSASNLVVNLSSRGLATGNRESVLRFAANAPNARLTEIPLAMLVRRPPSIEIVGAAQVSTNGEGHVMVVAEVYDVDGESCDIALEYSVDSGTTWSNAWIASATATFGSVSICNGAPSQLLGIVTRTSSEPAVTNTLQAVWSTTNNLGAILVRDALVRMCAHDGNFWSQMTTGLPFVVDNEPPSAPSSLTVETHQPQIWSTNRSMTVRWGLASDGEGSGVGSYGVLYTTQEQIGPPFCLVTSELATDLLLPSDGTNWWIKVQALDRFGNCGPPLAAGPFWIDSIPPSATGAIISVEWSPFGKYVVGTNIICRWSGFEDELSGIADYFVSFTNGGGTTNGLKTATAEALLAGAIPDRTNTVYIWARDNAGLIGPAAQQQVLVLNPATDYDGDGYSTAEEEIAGTAADDPESRFGFCAATFSTGSVGASVIVSWPTIAGRLYSLYCRENLTTNETWAPIIHWTNVPGTDGMMSYTDIISSIEWRFYRVTVDLP
ncbi:MAG: S8 family serine peptidase [Kiritimatiellia bacterium]